MAGQRGEGAGGTGGRGGSGKVSGEKRITKLELEDSAEREQ